jgi:DNA-binding MarR family transcriptional regulator
MIERNSNVPRIVDRLVAKKYVERSTSEIDKRETAIRLTNSGIDILLAASPKINSLFSQAVAIEDNEAVQLDMLLEKMREKE